MAKPQQDRDRRGAPVGNRNAARSPEERVQYWPQRFFAFRWREAEGQAISEYLEATGLSQREWLEHHLLPLARAHQARNNMDAL